MKNKLKIFEAFAGYGSQSMAGERYCGGFESVGISEVDESAILSYAAVHCEDVDVDYPPIEKMLKSLESMNIGRNFKTGVVPWTKMLGTLKKKGRLSPATIERVRRVSKACYLTKNYGDISKINPLVLPDHDVFTYSFSCQDVSAAGKNKGLKEGSGTRSSMLWECQKIIEMKRPKYLMMENVKNLVGKKHKPDFDRWLQVLDQLGYNNHWRVINAKNCGVPQNRERVFCVSVLKEYDDFGFHFYDNFDSGVRLKDILEDQVDEKYYLSDEKTKSLIESLEANGYNGYKRNYECDGNSYCIDANYHKGTSVGNIGKARRTHVVEQTNNLGMVGVLDIKGNESIRRVYEPGGVSPALTTMQGGNRQPKIVEACRITGRNPDNPKSRVSGLPTKQMLEVRGEPEISGCLTTVQKDTMLLESQVLRTVRTEYGKRIRKAYEAGEVKESRHNMRVYEPRKDGVSNTITTVQKDNYLLEQPQFRIRKLTPKECFRLMGVSDSDIDKIQSAGISNSQQYKMAGNSIVVDCMKFLEQLK